MEGNREIRQWQTQPPPPPPLAAGTKVERKVMEKNRRNQMKLLYSKLKSLLPDQPSNVAMNVSDQVEEAINYIKSLETKLKRQQEKKEWLLRSGRSSSDDVGRNLPELKIREMGSAVEVVLTSGLGDWFIFYQIIHIFPEERAQIINASYSVLGTTVFYTLHAEIEDVVYEFGARKLTERLKKLVYGSTSDAEITQPSAAASYIHPPGAAAAYTPTTYNPHFRSHEI
ncbi:transcription factor bHLH162-like [Momordica charantia]|uniref:Transcription factor bHLH162-like n=1 Tax=Momordica charantia TaxID=3673 RepID=A0A6J1CGH0_MOMCH|nr:transcription factor bHLH162-like [Momordica charantia]